LRAVDVWGIWVGGIWGVWVRAVWLVWVGFIGIVFVELVTALWVAVILSRRRRRLWLILVWVITNSKAGTWTGQRRHGQTEHAKQCDQSESRPHGSGASAEVEVLVSTVPETREATRE